MNLIKDKVFNNLKAANLVVLSLVLVLFSYYIYQTVSISSNNVSLVSSKKEFLERKNNLSLLISQSQNYNDFNPDSVRENLKMSEIEKFDYIIIGPSEFAFIKGDEEVSQ